MKIAMPEREAHLFSPTRKSSDETGRAEMTLLSIKRCALRVFIFTDNLRCLSSLFLISNLRLMFNLPGEWFP
jgi:hypothetical protein